MKMKVTGQQDGNSYVNYKQIFISVFLLVFLVGSIFSYVPFLNQVDEIAEHKKLYPKIEEKANNLELALFKKYKEQLPKGYSNELIKIKKNTQREVKNYKLKKTEIKNKQMFFSFYNKSSFFQYMGMYLAFIALSICSFIYVRVKDKTAKFVFELIFFGSILIGLFFIHYALYENSDIPRGYHYIAAISYILLSVITLFTLHKYLKNYSFYSAAIQKLNGLLINHPTKYISPEKHKEYFVDTVNKIDETLYPNNK